MKKITILLLFISLLSQVSYGEQYRLKLRSSHHGEILRIVLEGPKKLIDKAIVNQEGNNIRVTFPGATFIIEEEKTLIVYNKITADTVLFFPRDFKGFKVFTLEHPDRLVIDIYLHKIEIEGRKPIRSGVHTVVIDPGHGGYEHGITKGKYKEKNIVLDIAKKLRALVGRGDKRCFLTRGSDRFLNLNDRVRLANNKGPDVFLSLHVGNSDRFVLYFPVITYSAPPEIRPFLVNRGQEGFMERSAALINAMKEAITSEFGEDAVSVRPLPYSILSRIEAAALMIELPSFDNARYVNEFRAEIAKTLHRGIYLYEENTAE